MNNDRIDEPKTLREEPKKCDWCEKPATVYLMSQPFCDKCKLEFAELHRKTNNLV